jgi:hypothetical protein
MRYLDSRRFAILALLAALLLSACCAPASDGGMDVRGTREAAREAVTETPAPTRTRVPTRTPPPTLTFTPEPTAEPEVEPTLEPTGEPVQLPTEEPTEIPASSPVPLPLPSAPASGAVEIQLERIPDHDPGPPFTLLADTIRIRPDGRYEIVGRVHNDGTEIYEGISVRASFLDDKGGGYGPVDVYAPCPFLEPGAECPFSLQMYARPYVAYRLHTNGTPVVYRQPAPLAISDLSVFRDGVGNVRIQCTATNGNAFTVRNPTIVGALIDAEGDVVSVGSYMVLGEVAPGASVPFDVRVEYWPYATYQLYAQATQD